VIGTVKDELPLSAHIITSSHHHIITSSHHHIITSSHHHIITSSHHQPQERSE
jgi:hypothetical protein